jgi:SNF2 family DNA or RNA helicase
MKAQQLSDVCESLSSALDAGVEQIELAGAPLPATPETLRAVQVQQEMRSQQEAETKLPSVDDNDDAEMTDGPIIIETKVIFEELHWLPARGKRERRVTFQKPPGILTPLRDHQTECLDWQIEAWSAGLPGVLNADEQGLGKTLETIAFLKWLKCHMTEVDAEHRGPVLIVAPTSLLENWEAEVSRHLEEQGLGHLIRLYGSALAGYKRTGSKGVDTKTGEELLDFDLLHESIAEGRGHRFWMLTTYTTLTNYQHSLARIPFSAAVFDEIQAVKNPASLRAHAGRVIRADFRIGLTGTPIENSTTDLWAIMDQLCPGALDTLRDFRSRYGTPDQGNMDELHARVFQSQNSLPPLAIRRMKEMVASDLPKKTRRLYPRLMPTEQATVYEDARIKLAEGSRGGALKMLHHIRSVSVHPTLDAEEMDASFITASGRLAATFDILRMVKAGGERALVFIEHRKMQYRFIELVRQEFGLDRVDLINGDTPIQKRQAIVDRFQCHLSDDKGFDMLVLGPKAAGTGLTLTAATHVIHLSRWWNPAVEEQCNDRIHRLGQTHDVTIHVPMSIHPGYQHHSFDCLLHSLMTRKRRLASSALWPMGDTSEDAAELQRMVAEDQIGESGDPVVVAMEAMFARDNLPMPEFN